MMVSFDCRGLEPVDWECRGGFIAKTEKGKTFELRIQSLVYLLRYSYYVTLLHFVVFKYCFGTVLKVPYFFYLKRCYVIT